MGWCWGCAFERWQPMGVYVGWMGAAHSRRLSPPTTTTGLAWLRFSVDVRACPSFPPAAVYLPSLQHEDRGCMKVVKWACPDFNETQPEICRDYKYPVPATYTKGAPFPTAPPAAAPAPAAPLPSAAVRRSGGAAQWLLTLAACLLVAARLP